MTGVWEYEYVQAGTNDLDRFKLHLLALGSLGWEVVGVTSQDRTVGVNSIVAILKRPAVALPSPEPPAAGWHRDPTGRFEQRYFDGLRWTEHVTSGGSSTTDYPNVRD